MSLDMGIDRDIFGDPEEQRRRRRPEEATQPVLESLPALPGPVLGIAPDEPRATTPVVRDPNTGRIVTDYPILPAPPAPTDELIFTDPATRMLEEFTRRRFRELQGPAFSATEENQRRAGVFDELERQRQNAHRQAVERLATMGQARTSGIFEDTARRIDEAFDRMRSERERDLALQGIGRRDTMQREALALASLLPELVERRLQLATGTLTGAAPSPQSIFQQLSQLVGQAQRGEELQAQQRGSSMGGLGQILGLLLSGGLNFGPAVR